MQFSSHKSIVRVSSEIISACDAGCSECTGGSASDCVGDCAEGYLNIGGTCIFDCGSGHFLMGGTCHGNQWKRKQINLMCK